jgi:hypothetical protein
MEYQRVLGGIWHPSLSTHIRGLYLITLSFAASVGDATMIGSAGGSGKLHTGQHTGQHTGLHTPISTSVSTLTPHY